MRQATWRGVRTAGGQEDLYIYCDSLWKDPTVMHTTTNEEGTLYRQCVVIHLIQLVFHV